ncbi:hypothetical protein MTR72_25750 [Bradyrhizobium sp. ISRA442]|uniref:hypothetical protein n=1 Tax=Bradyrhizobium sp. ISRA442 TaxID=2866197 RepID=UPI00311ABD3D
MVIAEYDGDDRNQHGQSRDQRRATLPSKAGQIGQKRQPSAEDERNRHRPRKPGGHAIGAQQKYQRKDDEHSGEDEPAEVAALFVCRPAFASRRDRLPEPSELGIEAPEQASRPEMAGPQVDPGQICTGTERDQNCQCEQRMLDTLHDVLLVQRRNVHVGAQDRDLDGHECQQSQQTGQIDCRALKARGCIHGQPGIAVDQHAGGIMGRQGPEQRQHKHEQNHPQPRVGQIRKLREQVLRLRRDTEQKPSEHGRCRRHAEDPQDERSAEHALPPSRYRRRTARLHRFFSTCFSRKTLAHRHDASPLALTGS